MQETVQMWQSQRRMTTIEHIVDKSHEIDVEGEQRDDIKT
jgi:hypothetical protein